MKKILNHINNNINPLENDIKRCCKEYYIKSENKDKLDKKLKELRCEYIKLEKIIKKELNKKTNIYL